MIALFCELRYNGKEAVTASEWRAKMKKIITAINNPKLNEELKKELQDLKDKGMVLPKRIAPAIPRKGQRLKETIRPVEVVK